MSPLIESLSIAAPEIILALGALTLLLVGVFSGDRRLGLVSWLAVLLYAIAVAATQHGQSVLAFNGLYVADNLSFFLKCVIFASSAVATIYALPYLRHAGLARFEYPVLILLATVGMGIMVSAHDFLSLYIGLELQALSLYILAAFARDDVRSAESGLKYFVLGALASGIILYGVTLLYGFGGSTDFAVLHDVFRAESALSPGVVFGMTFILAGLAFKISAAPFHMWAPDVYEGAPTPVTAFFATAPKIAAMGVLLRLSFELFPSFQAQWRYILVFMAVASMIVGALGAIGQNNIKRLLAYSSINNIGFAMIGIVVGGVAGASSLLFYLLVYVVVTIGCFLVLLALRDENGRPLNDMSSFSGLARRRPALAAAMAIFMFSLAGIPPLLGFWPKWAVLSAAVDADFFTLAVIAVVTSVIAAYYYLRIVKVMYFDEAGSGSFSPDSRINGGMVALAALFCSPLGMFLLPSLGVATHRAAMALFP